jgi:adenylate cyclase class IV
VTVFEFREEVVESLQEQEQEFVDDESDDDMFYQIPEVVKRNFLKRKGLIK